MELSCITNIAQPSSAGVIIPEERAKLRLRTRALLDL